MDQPARIVGGSSAKRNFCPTRSDKRLSAKLSFWSPSASPRTLVRRDVWSTAGLAQVARIRLLCVVLFAALCVGLPGCRSTPRTYSVERPRVHNLKTDSFEIRSNFPIADDSPLAKELLQLKATVQQTLQLPEQRDPVIVYLFSDEQSYRRYMHHTWPKLPARRAYFVGTSRELAVYSYHSEYVEEDLRHEFTHGLLHASLNTVPLWLDEGLAEYFEVRGNAPGLPHTGHIQFLQEARSEGWTPSLYDLEHLTDFRRMTQREYAEAWGWVHFMLNSTPEARQVLMDYVAQLQTRTVASPLLPKLEQAVPTYFNDMTAHVGGMSSSGIRTVGFQTQ